MAAIRPTTRAAIRSALLPILTLAAGQAAAQAPAAALGAISEQGLLGHIKTLASDEFEAAH